MESYILPGEGGAEPVKKTPMVVDAKEGSSTAAKKATVAKKTTAGKKDKAGTGVYNAEGRVKKKPGRKARKFTRTGRRRQNKDPCAPQRARTAFNFFMSDFRVKYLAEHPETKGVIEVTKAAALAWKVLKTEDRKDFDDKAAVEKEKYAKAKAEYLANAGPEKFKLKMNHGKPKRPPTSYFHFLAYMRKTLRKPDGSPLEVKEISKRAGEKWRMMTKEEKAPYETLAAEAKAKFDMLRQLSPDELAFVMKKEPYYTL
ncbi:HMG-box domain-containing protein [Chloropicon primus]|uniref:HMG box domain-containing protein n=1 Tax=Chloropicon primus TaxID=1764295 RepID=A0A5B8MIW6_9CHLO|nr:hypothetical protein A3770_04p28750 [Chloropicon primus]UPQ99565.1 HMG-box domain-containing protein [Chloropicon primus]|eukprot:QDZ20357.1 hypothetical protein A3770_04p28750 [Chloropicon primus]